MVMMGVGACASFLLMPPSRVIRDDGTQVSLIQTRGFVEELKANLEIFRDWKLLIMVIYIPRSCSSEYDIAIDPIVTNMRPADIPIATPAKIGNPLLPVWSKYIRLPT